MSPLIKGKSKKSFSKNVETEMDAGKPKDQSLAIAYNLKRQASKKKMASGGKVGGAETGMLSAGDSRGISSIPADPISGMEDLIQFRKDKKDLAALQHREMLAAGGEVLSQDYAEDEHALHGSSPMGGALHSDAASVMGEQSRVDSDVMSRRKRAMSFDSGEAGYEESGAAGSGIMLDAEENKYADGGRIEDSSKPHSMAEIIMMRRKKMADGGMVDIESNEEEQPNGYYARNEDAALEEDYDDTMDGMHQPKDSNEKDPGDELLEESDEHDLVSKIMRKNKKK
jgi:hypothetical protein